MATNGSSISQDDDDGPIVNSDTSKGSSVSSGMEEEYNELLKYAVVIPKWNSQDPRISQSGISMPMLDLQQPPDVPLTTVNEYSSSNSSSTSRNDRNISTCRTNDAHDSAMGSDEIITDRKSFREPHPDFKDEIPILTSNNQNERNQIEVDPDIASMHEHLKTWNNKFNNMVLAEFAQAKMTAIENYRKMVYDNEMKHQAEMNKLQDEVENMKELLHTYETSLGRKDCVISNLTRALQTNKEKQEMMRALSTWKLRLNEEKRQMFTSCLARRHRERVLASRAWQSWRTLVEGGWREKVEKACQKKAREVCMQLTDDYEIKLSSLNDHLASSRAEIKRLQEDRNKYEETMKKAFMRGVCALNLEAMSMFHNEDGSEKNMEALSAAVGALSANSDQTQLRHPPHQQSPVKCQQQITLGRPTTVFSHQTNNLPFSNPVHHNADVTAHARTQVPVNSIPPQYATSSKPTKAPLFRNSTATSSKSICTKEKPPGHAPASIVVKRHHPNVQNHSTQRTLKHMVKYPNTPVRPICGK